MNRGSGLGQSPRRLYPRVRCGAAACALAFLCFFFAACLPPPVALCGIAAVAPSDNAPERHRRRSPPPTKCHRRRTGPVLSPRPQRAEVDGPSLEAVGGPRGGVHRRRSVRWHRRRSGELPRGGVHRRRSVREHRRRSVKANSESSEQSPTIAALASRTPSGDADVSEAGSFEEAPCPADARSLQEEELAGGEALDEAAAAAAADGLLEPTPTLEGSGSDFSVGGSGEEFVDALEADSSSEEASSASSSSGGEAGLVERAAAAEKEADAPDFYESLGEIPSCVRGVSQYQPPKGKNPWTLHFNKEAGLMCDRKGPFFITLTGPPLARFPWCKVCTARCGEALRLEGIERD